MIKITIFLISIVFSSEVFSDYKISFNNDNIFFLSPPKQTGFREIAMGSRFGLAIKQDGSLVSWGDEIIVPGGDSFKKVDASGNNFYALDNNGVIYNSAGQLSIENNFGFKDIATGSNFGLGLKENGEIVGFGSEVYGEVSNVPSGVFKDIAADANYGVALREDGEIIRWGRNDQYGYPDLPVDRNNIIKIAVGGTSHFIGIREDGSLVGSGDNNYGQATVPSGYDYVDIKAGGHVSAALRSDGSIIVFGRDVEGSKNSVSLETNFNKIDVSPANTIAIRKDGSINVWGIDSYGQVSEKPLLSTE